MKKIILILRRNEYLIANTVFVAGLVLMGIAAYTVLYCSRVSCFGF